MQALGKGCIEFDNCSLKGVLYVLKLTTNLLSVNSITRNGSCFHRRSSNYKS